MSSRDQNRALGTGIGAVAGSFIPIPGVGTLAGAALGGIAGSAIGGMFGQDNNQYTPDPAQPLMDPYRSVNDPNGGLASVYRVQAGKLGDTSAWQNLARQQNTANTNASVAGAQTQAQTGAQGAWSQLAMNGGLNGGASERIAKQGSRDAMFAGQQARQEGANNDFNIGLQGEQMNRAGDQFNIGNQFAGDQYNSHAAMGDVANQNQYNMTGYGERMKGWSATVAANAARDAQANQHHGLLSGIF